MRTVQCLGNQKVEIAETTKPEPSDLALVMKVKASAICGSELHALRMSPDEMPDGFDNGGHEVAGIVEEAPANSGFKPGDRVGARIIQGCGECDFCREGYETACPDKKFHTDQGGHAEYYKLGVQGAHRVPDDCDWPEAALLTGDGLGVPIRTARRLGDTAGQRIVMLGLGPIGLSNTLVQSSRGARVMGVDLSEYRINLARELGAETCAHVTEGSDVKQAVMDWTDGRGADIVIIGVGREDVMKTSFDLVRQQGTVFMVGELEEVTFNPSALFIRREATMTGSWYYTSSDWPDMLAAHESGMPYHKLITHKFPFEQAQAAFDTFVSGESGKVILTYE